MKYDPKTLNEEYDEFAEACIRFVKPRMALEALEPVLIEAISTGGDSW